MNTGICAGCQQEKPIKAKGFCRACYQQWKRTGSTERERMPRGVCTVPGCDKPAHGKGVCDMHIKRMKVSGSYDAPRADNVNLKTNQAAYVQWMTYRRGDGYPIVKEWFDDFFVFFEAVGERPSPQHRLHRLDKNKPMGPGNFEWRAKFTTGPRREGTMDYNARYRRERKEATGSAMWDSELRAKYGADFGRRELFAMAEAQNHRCAICGAPETIRSRNGVVRFLCVDHDHRTGKVRQLVCSACNSVLGDAEDDIRILEAAIAYLIKHKAEPGETRFVPPA